MARFTVHQGKRYAARISLTFLESFASNDDIANRFRNAGFIGVDVTGSGNYRTAHGIWVGDDTTAELPSQIIEVKELEE